MPSRHTKIQPGSPVFCSDIRLPGIVKEYDSKLKKWIVSTKVGNLSFFRSELRDEGNNKNRKRMAQRDHHAKILVDRSNIRNLKETMDAEKQFNPWAKMIIKNNDQVNNRIRCRGP